MTADTAPGTAPGATLPEAEARRLFACVGFMARPHLRRLSVEQAKVFKERYGSRTLMYCTTAQEAAFYKASGAFDETPLHEKVEPGNLGVSDPAEVLARARRIEADYGVTMNHLALTNRHLGRGFALGGFHHPRSRLSEAATYNDMLKMLCDQVDYWEHEIRDRGLTVFLNAGWLSAMVFDRLAVPMRSLVYARLHGRYMWAFDGWDRTPLLDRAFTALRDVDDLQPPDMAPPVTHLDFRARMLRTRSTALLVTDLARTVAQQIYWQLRGFQKAKGYLLSQRLSGRIRQWRDVRRVTGPRTTSLKDLAGQPFVFYPLHTEPEKALQTLSPLHFYQLSAIAAVARDLPAGVKLVVKEHAVATGRRPDCFYDQIQEFKNVELLNMAEIGVDVVTAASAVVTITSTAGLEAAMAGKPVITFGRHNIYNCMSHVRVVTDEADLKPALDDALTNPPAVDAARREAGRFAEALRLVSFEIPDFSEGRPDAVPPEAALPLVDHLVETFAERPYGLA